MNFLKFTNRFIARRELSRYNLPSVNSTKYDEFGKTFKTNLNYNVVQIGDFIDQNLNQGESVPSLLIDQLIIKIETTKQFEDIGYYLWRFRHSVFGYKMRPWTQYLLTVKGVELEAYDTLTEMITDSDKFGYYPDAMTVHYLILTLLEHELQEQAVQIVQYVVLKDMATTAGLAHLCAIVLALHADLVAISVEEKHLYAIFRTLGSLHPELSFLNEYGNRGLATLQKDNRILKNDHYFINPHLNYESLTSIKKEMTFEEVVEAASERILKDVKDVDQLIQDDIEEGRNQCRAWEIESSKLHSAYSKVIQDRTEWTKEYTDLEATHKAGIQYALTQTGLWNQRQVMEGLGTTRMPKITPPYIEHKHHIVAISDLELEQDVYEEENGEEWDRIRTFFENRVLEKTEDYRARRAPMRKGYRTNERWEANVLSQFSQPTSVPKLPID